MGYVSICCYKNEQKSHAKLTHTRFGAMRAALMLGFLPTSLLSGSRGLSPTIGIYRDRSGESAAIPVCLLGYGFPLKISTRGSVLSSIPETAMRSNVSTASGVLDSESPVTRSRRLRCVQDRIAASHERIEPVRLGLGPLEPLLPLRRALIVIAPADLRFV